MPWHRAASTGRGICCVLLCVVSILFRPGPGQDQPVGKSLVGDDPRVRHNGTTVDTTPGPREGKVEGGVVQWGELAVESLSLRERAMQISASQRRRPSCGRYRGIF